MGIWPTSTDPITEEVEAATNEKTLEEDWQSILSVCDKAGKSTENAKAYLRAITKRLYNTDPHVALRAVTVLDACVQNSGKTFHFEVASRDFENDFNKLMTKAHGEVTRKLKECLKKWSENEFKNDGQLSLIPSLYSKLKSSGVDFSATEMPVKKSHQSSNEEEEQIMKAIELSLQDSSSSPRASASTSLYPTNLTALSNSQSALPAKEPIKVRALYDFQAEDDSELTFSAGEIIVVTDDSDPNWWKGSNQRGEGLFPSNFTTTDLSVEPEKFLYEKAKKIVQFKETVDVKEDPDSEEVEINEDKIDRLLHLLHEADPTNPEKDTEEMLLLEREVINMGPMIDSELERVDRKHAQLTQLSADLVEALTLYHTLMREPALPINKMSFAYNNPTNYSGYPPQHMMGPPMGGPSSIPMGMDRQPYLPQGGPQSMPHGAPQNMPHGAPQNMPQGGPQSMPHFSHIPVSSGMLPSHAVPLPSHAPPGNMMVSPGMMQAPPPGLTEGRNLSRFDLPSYGPSPTAIPNFQVGGVVNSQTAIQNGPPQQGHFTNSNSRLM